MTSKGPGVTTQWTILVTGAAGKVGGQLDHAEAVR
jgi:hypothetical protein